MTDNSQKAQCKHCFHFLSVGSNTTLRNHITHPHCEAKKAQQNQNPEAGQTSMARDRSVFSVEAEVEHPEPGFELQGAKMVEMGRSYGAENANEVLVTKGALKSEVGHLDLLEHEVGRICDE
ncbi:hypothetical protein Tco_1562433 [Tanacetum coccineum]